MIYKWFQPEGFNREDSGSVSDQKLHVEDSESDVQLVDVDKSLQDYQMEIILKELTELCDLMRGLNIKYTKPTDILTDIVADKGQTFEKDSELESDQYMSYGNEMTCGDSQAIRDMCWDSGSDDECY